MVLTVLLVTSRTVALLPGQDVHGVLTLSQQISHAKLILDQGSNVLASSIVPFGQAQRTVVLSCAVAVVLIALLVRRRSAGPRGAVGRLERWLGITALATCGVVAAWLVLIPADPYYSPQEPGVGNRIDTFAGVCLCILVYALVMLLATLIGHAPRRRRGWAGAAALALAAAIGIGYVHRLHADNVTWSRASSLRDGELALLRRALPKPAHGTRILLFGAPAYVAPGVPVFAAPWDLNGAVKLVWDDPSLSGYPVIVGTQVVCGAASILPAGDGYDPSQTAPYGTGLFVNAATGAAQRNRSQAECKAALRRYPAGPLFGMSASAFSRRVGRTPQPA